MTKIPFSPGDRIFGYLRDSGHEDQELSIEQQEASLRKWAAEHNLVITHIYKDEAKRGSSVIKRDELQAMMYAFRHECSERGVVVWKYNRFARSVDNAQFFRAEIRTLGYIFHSMNDKVPDGPMGRLFEAAIDFKDEQYLEDLSLDVKRGLYNLVERYRCVPGSHPRGFMREPVTIGLRRDGTPHIAHKWLPDPDFIPRVRRAFEMRARRISLGEIHKETKLYSGINSYSTFFANTIYKGTLTFGEMVFENYCEPIVSPELWDQVQIVQNYYARRKHVSTDSMDHPRRAKSRFLLSGIGRCAHCGSPLFGRSSPQKSGKSYDSYFCTRAYRKRDCTKSRIPRETVENAVVTTLTGVALKPENLLAAYEQLKSDSAKVLVEQTEKRLDLKTRLASVRKKISNLMALLEDLGRDAKAPAKRLKELEMDETDLESQLAELDAAAIEPIPEIPPDILAYIAVNFARAFAAADLDTQRLLLRLVVDHVEVRREDKMLYGVIYYYYPPVPLPKAPGPAVVDDVSIFLTPSGPPNKSPSPAIYFFHIQRIL
jgi:DNA invertase Pin-like site-specific DNA recombinase